MREVVESTVQVISIEVFAIEDDVRFDDSATLRTTRDLSAHCGVEDVGKRVLRIAFEAVVVLCTTVEFDDIGCAGDGVKTVDVLGENALNEATRLHFSQSGVNDAWRVCVVWLDEDLQGVEVFWVNAENVEREDILDAHAMPIVSIKTIGTAEVGNAGKRGDSCAGKHDGFAGVSEQCAES